MVALLYTAIEDSLIVNLLISGKGGRFSGGFDISVMQKVHRTGKLYAMITHMIHPFSEIWMDTKLQNLGKIMVMSIVSYEI